MDSLRIGLVAPPWFAVPPTGYGGIEWVVSNLAEGLIARGHEVTLFASGGSQTSAELVTTYAVPPSAELGDAYVEAPALIDAYQRWREFDVIHDHTLLGLVAGACLPAAVVHTVHGEVTPKLHRIYEHVGDRVQFVTVSNNQAATMPAECPVTVIHNGVNLARFPFADRGRGGYLLFVGRMSPEKGILQAIEIARRSGIRLRIMAKVNEPPEKEYFESTVKPALRGVDHELVFAATHDEKVAAYQDALATLFPIAWPEPFGLVMTESMACGTPVIAFRHGSVPEVIADGETGFICEDVAEAVRAVDRVGLIDRRRCRQRVEDHFSAERNVENHERLYRRVAEGDFLIEDALREAATILRTS